MKLLFGIIFLARYILVQCNNDNKFYHGVPDDFFKDCLSEINKYRKLHGALPLRWSADLQFHAQDWADKLARHGRMTNDVEGIDKLGQGETISYLSPPKAKCRTFPPEGDCYACRTTIATWYNESEHYDYKTGFSLDRTKQVLHFTQLVWKDTAKVGLATSISPRYGIVIVARFHPRGNIGYIDDYIANVGPRDESQKNDEDEFETNGEGNQGGPPCRHKRRRTNNECRNEYGDELCDYQVQRFLGYCEYNKVFMAKHCAKSCGFCKERLPSPPKETKEQKRLNLRWETGKWQKCRGGLQWRPVRCYHRFKGVGEDSKDYQVKARVCHRLAGPKPSEYRDC